MITYTPISSYFKVHFFVSITFAPISSSAKSLKPEMPQGFVQNLVSSVSICSFPKHSHVFTQ